VAEYLDRYLSVNEACADLPWLDDILSGVLALRTEGDTGTRSLSRKVLFRILRRFDAITTRSLTVDLAGRYSGRTVERYAATARVASHAIAAHIAGTERKRPQTLKEAREALDAPHAVEAAKAEAQASQRPQAGTDGLRPFDPLREMSPSNFPALPRARRATLELLIGVEEFP
jgi:hypothetical protein